MDDVWGVFEYLDVLVFCVQVCLGVLLSSFSFLPSYDVLFILPIDMGF